ncbi:LPS export ABC transporter periplasmic protein LptC [Thermodesulfobacteriota bacterium]
MRFSKIILNLIAVFCVIGLVYVFLHHRSRPIIQDEPLNQENKETVLNHRHLIQGFRYDAYVDGNNILSISADEFRVRKKKIGFFRFALMNEAEFINASVRFYNTTHFAQSNQLFSETDLSNTENALTRKSLPPPRHSLKKQLNCLKEALPALPLKQISALRLAPVEILLQAENSIITRITAHSAKFRLKQQDILFQGNVKVISGPKALFADQLVLNPVNGILSTNSNYSFEGPSQKFGGKPIVTNVFLSSFIPG